MINKSRVVFGDCRVVMQQWIDWGIKVQMCFTSPPYFGLRDYGTGTWDGGDSDCDHLKPAEHGCDTFARSTLGPKKDGINPGNSAHSDSVTRQQYQNTCPRCGATRTDSQLGLEPTPEEFVSNLVEVFRLVRDLLADDGVLFLNLGDSYCSTAPGTKNSPMIKGSKKNAAEWANARPKTPPGLKPKDLIGIPWRVAFALQADGWYLRQDIIWSKPNPMPESVTDRCTKAHEYMFLLSKQPRYYFDNEAIKEKAKADHLPGNGKRNKRSVWMLPTRPYKGAHFATFPPALIEPCILAGSRQGDTVLDPFFGSGTTGMMAKELGRKWLGCDLNKDYEALMLERLGTDMVSTMVNENHYYPR